MISDSHLHSNRKNAVDLITAHVRAVLEGYQEVYAAILMGSCSRGEESYYLDAEGQWQLLSDYEFTVITNSNMIPEALDEKLKDLNSFLKKKVKSPFFNLEWNYVWKKKLPMMDKRFINFEMAEARCMICGDETVFSLFPKIDVGNLNFAELNSVVNHRLYHVLRDFTQIPEHQQKYLIARNTLDILSVVLPYEGMLICSYQKRLEHFPKALIGTKFSADILNRLRNCLEMKKNYSSVLYEKLAVEEMLDTFIEDMRALHEFQKEKQNGTAFSVDRRRLVKAVLKLRKTEIRQVLARPDEEEKLYQDMMCSLENRDFIPGNYPQRMIALYQYQ